MTTTVLPALHEVLRHAHTSTCWWNHLEARWLCTSPSHLLTPTPNGALR